jgi:DNA polymerase
LPPVIIPATETRLQQPAPRIPAPIPPTPRAIPPQPRPTPKETDTSTLFGDFAPDRNEALPLSDETFEEIWADVGNCTRCGLCAGRTHVVHTEGNQKARLMFIGEAPGADEDAQARPFVGRAGQLLTKIIEAIGFKREDVLIGNINRCRPPGNRAPLPDEVAMCKPFLLREIAAARPEVIVVLGNTAMKNLLATNAGITRARGIFQNYKGVKVMPTFHPAYLLRDPTKKRETWEDLKKVRDYLDSTAPGNC